jgi:hypothetical protein
LGIRALDLLVQGLDVRGEEAMELEGVALFLGESRALVEVRRSQECIALKSSMYFPYTVGKLYRQACFLCARCGKRQVPELLVLLLFGVGRHVGCLLLCNTRHATSGFPRVWCRWSASYKRLSQEHVRSVSTLC